MGGKLPSHLSSRRYVAEFFPSLCLPQIWDFETIDGADVLEEDANFPMEPMSDMYVGDGAKVISMCKTVSENNNDTNSMWLAQG